MTFKRSTGMKKTFENNYGGNQMSFRESKITARIDSDLYNKVQSNFHHGQQTQLFRNIFKSLDEIISGGNFDAITDYLYKGKPLTLPKMKDV